MYSEQEADGYLGDVELLERHLAVVGERRDPDQLRVDVIDDRLTLHSRQDLAHNVAETQRSAALQTGSRSPRS